MHPIKKGEQVEGRMLFSLPSNEKAIHFGDYFDRVTLTVYSVNGSQNTNNLDLTGPPRMMPSLPGYEGEELKP